VSRIGNQARGVEFHQHFPKPRYISQSPTSIELYFCYLFIRCQLYGRSIRKFAQAFVNGMASVAVSAIASSYKSQPRLTAELTVARALQLPTGSQSWIIICSMATKLGCEGSWLLHSLLLWVCCAQGHLGPPDPVPLFQTNI
jgi:hypothetical protein